MSNEDLQDYDDETRQVLLDLQKGVEGEVIDFPDTRILVMTSIIEEAAGAGAELKDEIESDTDYRVFHVREGVSVSGSSMLPAFIAVAIFILSNVGSRVTDDIYNLAKGYLSKQIEKRRAKKVDDPELYKETEVTIYGPNDKPLKKIRTKNDKLIEDDDNP